MRYEKGFTILEVMIALMIAGIFLTGLFQIFTTFSGNVTEQIRVGDIQQNLRASMYVIEQRFKQIGYNPKYLLGVLRPGIVSVGVSSITFQADLNENGHSFDIGGAPSTSGLVTNPENPSIANADDPNEVVSIGLFDAGGASNDADGNGIADSYPSALRMISNNVVSAIANDIEVVNLVYLDQEGAPLTDDTTGAVLAAVDIVGVYLDRIRKIQVTIIARESNKFGKGADFEYQDGFTFDDPQGVELLKPSDIGDNLRRRMLSKTIDCRNLGL